MSNQYLPIYAKAHDKASDYLGKASTWLLLSSYALRQCIAGQEVTKHDGKPFPLPEAFASDDTKALQALLIAKAGADSASEAKAKARFKGNKEREREITKEYRNKRNSALRDILPALTMAQLRVISGKDASPDFNKGSILIPCAWFLPMNAAPSEAQSLLGASNPMQRMVAATTTTEKEEITFFTVEGFADYEKEAKRCSEAQEEKPSPFEYVSLLSVGVNAVGLQTALDHYKAAKTAQEKLQEAKAKAAQALETANAAQAIVETAKASNASPEMLAKAQQAATVAKTAQEQAASEAAQAASEADKALPKTAQRKPGGMVNQSGASIPIAPENRVMTISTACDFLAHAAMGDDCKRNFAPSVMENWQELANAIWRNPNLAHAFLIERNAVQKEQAEEQAQKKSA